MALSWSVSKDIYKNFGCKLFKSKYKWRPTPHIVGFKSQYVTKLWPVSRCNVGDSTQSKEKLNYPQLSPRKFPLCIATHGFHSSNPLNNNGVPNNEEAVLKNKARQEEKRRQKDLRRKAFEERQKANLKAKLEKKNPTYTQNTPPGEKKDITCALPATYSSAYVEAAWYSWWEQAGFFKPEYQDSHNKRDDVAEKFVICLPPPNVTGTLHLGHALGSAIEDAITRWHRMRGTQTLWLPGSDHAGIATQVVVERHLWRTQGITRHEIGREQFEEQVWKWKNEKGNVIYDQLKKLGVSLDWSRECFTLDSKMNRAVTEAFVRLYNEGLIYRSEQLVNWSCALKSTISDIEVDDVEIKGRTKLSVPGYEEPVQFGTLTYFAYPLDNLDGEIVVATTRLETMLGDMAVAVHPDDDRYSHCHGAHVRHPVTNALLPVICDEAVNPQFGTGAVKITPAHDQNDYNMSQRHDLSPVNILDDSGCLVNVPPQFQGMKRFDARVALEKVLADKGLLRQVQDHDMVLPVCSRSKDVIEPRLKEQWYIKCDDMAKQAIQVVENGSLEIIPNNYEKQWYMWLENTGDWCVSRQLWWGHRIPAYRVTRKVDKLDNTKGSHWVVGRSHEEAKIRASKELGVPADEVDLQQDEDVLDTWFSSALFPFSVFGWPQSTVDLHQFYPTQLLETASDIMFFWVARMVMLGTKLTGQLPFNQVLFHGILRDAYGRKMSKSLGNVIDPMDVIKGITLEELHNKVEQTNLDLIEIDLAKQGQTQDFPMGIPECGADALRFTLCSYNFHNHYVNLDVGHVEQNKRFCNKIWQAFKYTQSHLGTDFTPWPQHKLTDLQHATDRWIMSSLSELVTISDEGFHNYKLHHVCHSLNNFWWADLCDVYLEYTKPIFQGEDHERKEVVKQILYTSIETGLRLLSPFMPFITEELFQRLPRRADSSELPSICVTSYPSPKKFPWKDHKIEEEMKFVREVITRALSIRKQFNLKKERAPVIIIASEVEQRALLNHLEAFTVLSRSGDVQIINPSTDGAVSQDSTLVQDCVSEKINDQCCLYMRIKELSSVQQ